MVYLKDSLIVNSFLFMFIHNITLLQRFVEIATGVGVENPGDCCPRSQKPRVLISTLSLIELFDALSCSSSPDNGVILGSISMSWHTSDIIFAV